MTRHKGEHPHQSDILTLIPKNYIPYQISGEGLKTWGVIQHKQRQGFVIAYQDTLPQYGGYLSRESIYGNPSYCPNATRLHRQHQKETGSMPHLVFFDSAKTAKLAGLRRCKTCPDSKS